MRRYSKTLLAGTGVIVLLLSCADAEAKKNSSEPQPFKELMQCKQIAEPTARLACYDQQAAKLEQATTAGDLVVSDRQTIKDARRGLFGFKLPSLNIFGGGDDAADALNSVDSTISTARQFGYGTWRVTLADNSVWEQVDDQRLAFDPVSGNKVHIYKGALGTFRMNIDGQRAIKVRRVE